MRTVEELSDLYKPSKRTLDDVRAIVGDSDGRLVKYLAIIAEWPGCSKNYVIDQLVRHMAAGQYFKYVEYVESLGHVWYYGDE